MIVKSINRNNMMQLEIGDWYNWNNETEIVWYEFVDARRKLDKIKITLHIIKR